MSQYRKFFAFVSVAASLGTIVTHSVQNPTYPAMEPDEPARTAPVQTNWAVANRKPAVEPRVYVENVDSKTGFSYYDYPNQVRHAEPNPPQK